MKIGFKIELSGLSKLARLVLYGQEEEAEEGVAIVAMGLSPCHCRSPNGHRVTNGGKLQVQVRTMGITDWEEVKQWVGRQTVCEETPNHLKQQSTGWSHAGRHQNMPVRIF